MKKGFLPCLIFSLIVFILCMLPLFFIEHNQDDKPKVITPRIKVISNKSWAFHAYEINFGLTDKIIIIHHGWSQKLKTYNWGDATIVKLGEGYVE